MAEAPPAKKARNSLVGAPQEPATVKEAPSLTEAESRVVKIQFEKDCEYGIPFDTILSEYCRFMQIKLTDLSKPFAPSYVVDKIWHAHILSTKEYGAFLSRINEGAYVHHDPAMKTGQQRYQETLEAYKELYKEFPTNQDIWPDTVDEEPSIHKKEEEEDEDEDSDRNSSSEEEDSDEEPWEERSDKDRREYLEDFGETRGRTRTELAEWHRQAILDPSNNEGYDPREHPEVCNCSSGHRWYDGEFTLYCADCRRNSRGIGGFSCGGE
jgi:hypothetical protein